MTDNYNDTLATQRMLKTAASKPFKHLNNYHYSKIKSVRQGDKILYASFKFTQTLPIPKDNKNHMNTFVFTQLIKRVVWGVKW